MAKKDENFLEQAKNDFVGDEEKQAQDDAYYSDDVQAAAIADNNMDPDQLEEDDTDQVTSGEMEIGDLDDDEMVSQGDEDSYDEEQKPAGDNVVDNLP